MPLQIQIKNGTDKNALKMNFTACYEDADLVLRLYNANHLTEKPILSLSRNKVHFFFSLHQDVAFQFGPHYSRLLAKDKAFLIYNPERDLEAQLLGKEAVHLIHLSIRLDKLHQLFVPATHSAPIFDPENTHVKFYEEREPNAELLVSLNQIDQKCRSESSNRLFFQAKILEILSLLFTERTQNNEQCPFLKNELTVRKIKEAKDILLQNYLRPPTIPELAKQVQLNEFQLKAGFKEIYGIGPYHYLLEHKMEIARSRMLDSNVQVKQIAHEIGYSNISHFISAFKKQFGITPKKLLMNK